MMKLSEFWKDELMRAYTYVIILAVITVGLGITSYEYIGASDEARLDASKLLVHSGQQNCANFEMRYRPSSGQCYECYYPLKNAKSEVYNYVYKICYQEGSWNRTMKYAEPFQNGQ